MSSSLQIKAIIVSSFEQIGQCYFVIGEYVGRVGILGLQKDYFEQINQFQICFSDCKKGIQLWSYCPQKLIKKWKIVKNKWKLNGLSYSFEDQYFKIVLILKNKKSKINVSQKKQYRKRGQTNNKQKSNSNSKKNSLSNNTNNLIQIQKRLQQKLISLKRPIRLYSSEIQTCYSISRVCYLRQKNKQKINSTQSLWQKNEKNQLKKSKKHPNQSFNLEANDLYGLNELLHHKQQLIQEIQHNIS